MPEKCNGPSRSTSTIAPGQRLGVAQQGRLARVARVELAGERDLVEAESRLARGALERRQPVLAALVLGDAERDPLLRLERQRAVPELGAEAGVRAKDRRR